MPTVGWIQETGLDRLWETGSEPGVDALPPSYKCRHCEEVFDSLADREQHELEHPLYNPTVFFRDKELGQSTLLITAPMRTEDWDLRNVSKLSLNGQSLDSISQLQQVLQDKKRGLYTLSYANPSIEKQLKIEVCIADSGQLMEVDHAFKEHFSSGGITDQQVLAFLAAVKHCKTVGRYIDGLVRYIYGLQAKDQLSEQTSFEDFDKRFNQSLDALKHYDTGLAKAVRAVVRFNRNDFSRMQESSGLPELDNAVAVFHGESLLRHSSKAADAQLPVDYATEYILTVLMPAFYTATIDEFNSMAKNLSTRYRSLQDNNKLNYLCWRVAKAGNDPEKQEKYRRALQYDEVFNRLIRDTTE